jgi:hypothetical protein
MDRQEAIKQLKEAQLNGDTETAHADADDVLCELLKSLGYSDVVEEYNKVSKWFA